MKVLITGSCQASPAMLAKAEEVVTWCAEHGHQVIVGDAPGIDHQVRRLGKKLAVPTKVYGAYGNMREPEIDWDTAEHHTISQGYLARDRLMAQQCDICVAIWNGLSPGTRYTFQYANKLGKRVILRKFD